MEQGYSRQRSAKTLRCNPSLCQVTETEKRPSSQTPKKEYGNSLKDPPICHPTDAILSLTISKGAKRNESLKVF